MTPLATLRADAEALARQLPDATLSAEAANVLFPGAAGRKRVGTGEQFWQFRHYAQTDAADRIDWRRSARGDDYYVRETELETARTILFWVDADQGFHWCSDPGRRTKAAAAQTLMLAIGTLLSKSGERVGVVGSGRAPSLGKSAPNRLAEDLISNAPVKLSPPKGRSLAIVASDFYAGAESWQKRLTPLAQQCEHGVLLCISDPTEHDFPFSGRTRFSKPGSDQDRLFGRAETVRDAYLEKLDAHFKQLERLAGSMGWALVKYRTDAPLRAAGAGLLHAIEHLGGKT